MLNPKIKIEIDTEDLERLVNILEELLAKLDTRIAELKAITAEKDKNDIP